MNRAQYLALLEPAIALVEKKDQDYNSIVKREDYFPFGDLSYVQMIHVKSTRLRGLTGSRTQQPNFESVEDTLYDLINYSVFHLEHIKKTKEKIDDDIPF